MTAPALRRRTLLAAAAGVLAGCAARPSEERIVGADGEPLGFDALVARARAADIVLLGELHDNAAHHAARARLVLALGDGVTVVAEQLERGRRVAPGPDVRSHLVSAGFDERGWRWPLHEALFAPLLAAGVPVLGGNAPSALVRRVAREGESAWPDDLAVVARAAGPLAGAGLAALDADLIEGHCGHLPPARLPAMRAAQGLRDASMWQALAEAPGRRKVLVAGNGHVRRDYGVPRFAVAAPVLKLFCVGFWEAGDPLAGAPFDALWITRRAEREDPCAGMKPMR